ncbi:MAG: sigma-70 family RNA polymerase sigma factor [Burkholderiales bacterium]
MTLAIEIQKHRPYLLKFAMLQLREPSAAEDAVQETLLAAIQGAHSFAGQSALRTWLVGILKHKIIDHHRRQSREAPLSSDTDDFSIEDLDDLFQANGHYAEPPETWVSPDSALSEKKFFEALERCMLGLPVKCARAFMMREVMGMETGEICKELKITSTNCWVLLYRARMSLRACLEAGWFAGSKAG